MKEQHSHVATLPDALQPIPRDSFPSMLLLPDQAWQSRKYLVQLYRDENTSYPDMIRLSICRTRIMQNGRYAENISWDELQQIKRELGYGNWWGMEIYPADADVVNVANMRHLWLLPKPLAIGWSNDG